MCGEAGTSGRETKGDSCDTNDQEEGEAQTKETTERAESRDPTDESCEIGAADDASREKRGTPEHQQAEETGSGTEGESSLVTRMDMPGVQRSLTEQMLEPLELRETDAAAQRPGRVEGKQSKRGFFQGIKW